MCGICGVVQVGGEPREVIASWRLDAMTDAMVHRGPDDRGTVMLPGVALGARRLSIVDVAGGHQPFASEDERVWGMQNGELYNHVEIRRQLENDGHHFRSRCDTEILPHLYEQYGTSFVPRLHGKFGLAVWDTGARRAVIARDRLGVKPLYWAQVDDLVVFASELKSLLASGLIGPELDYEAIDAYLTFGFVPAPRTPLAGVNKLLPGHQLVIDPAGARLERYWTFPEPAEPDQSLSESDYTEQLLEHLREAVRLRLMSDVPLGAMLSGGLDSSLIVALMAEQTGTPVKTFSVGFREDAHSNELADARKVANLFGCDHHELELSFTDDTVDLPQLVWHLDEPVADLSALGFLALSHLARQHVTVALSGQGADELLGGYQRYRHASFAEMWRKLPDAARTAGTTLLLRGSARMHRAGEIFEARDAASLVLALYGRDATPTGTLRTGELTDRGSGAGRRAVERLLDGTRHHDALSTTLYVDAQLALPDDMLHYFDRTSMAHSLEVRVPFLDHTFVEWAAHVPPNLKVRRTTTKYLLKRAAHGILPDTIINKRKIGFFSGALDRWLSTKGRSAVERYLIAQPAPAVAPFIDVGELARLVDGTSGERAAVFRVLILEIWLTEFLPRAWSASEPDAHFAGVG